MNPPILLWYATATSTGKIVHGEVGAVAFPVEPTDLVVSGDSRAPNLDVIRIIPRQVGLAMTGHEFCEQLLLYATKVRAFVLRSEIK